MNTNSDQKPKKVQTAVTILYVTLGIGIIRAVIEASANAEMAGVGFLMFVTLVVFAFLAFLIAMIGSGKNWALGHLRVSVDFTKSRGTLPQGWRCGFGAARAFADPSRRYAALC